MLQDIRSNFLKGPLAKGIAVVIALSFALFGIQSILVGGSDDAIATVDDEKISESTLRDTVNNRMRRLAAMLGQDFDPTELDQERIKAEALSFLISDKILTNFISELELTIAESELGKEISLMESFKEGGRFSPDLYKTVITNAGYTPASFKAEAKIDILKRHLYTGIIGSDFITPLELELEARVSTEKRDVRYVKIPMSHFDKNAVVNESEIEDLYLKNQSFFSTEEEVSVEYIEIKSEQFIKPVEQQILINEYESVKQDYEQPQENRISHVLLIKKNEESEQEYQQRINLVEIKLSEGLELEEAARQFSDDTGSAQSGGDLGFSSGDVFPEEIEIAASELAVGEVSDRVKTEAGIHFLLLTDRQEKSQASFEDLQEQLTRKIQERVADALLLSLVEELRDVAFNSVGLNKVAEISNSQINISDLFSRS
ncbi:MAG: SurA N-terminal domain-containing protein, partial [Halieaceae bacterium]|nr:SurA N-terminal domain-containing protein [Halieaceae bacterium]